MEVVLVQVQMSQVVQVDQVVVVNLLVELVVLEIHHQHLHLKEIMVV